MSELLEELRSALSDRFTVESEVGRGGMATVFLAEDLKHGRRVAIKVMSPELSSSIDGDRFKREIQIAARLSHPHILPIFDSGDANGLLYYTMPFVEGESLRKRLIRQSQLPIEDAIAITCEVADALAYAHALNVVHRDIKPENILLHGGHAVVADFGIARVLQDSSGEKLTQTGMMVGTVTYMSPEAFGGGWVDGRSDMYSLACMLYEMLVGQVPFTGPNAMAIMARHTMEHVPSVRVVRPTVPEPLENALMQALEKTPADRFPSVAQFKEALLGGTATATYRRATYATTRVTTSVEVPKPRVRRSVIYTAAAIALLAVGGSVAAFYRSLNPSAASAATAPELRRIAVRYVEDQSRDSSFRHVADGLTESLIAQLGQVDGLSVISAAGVAPFRDPAVADDSVARALNVGLIVRGSVEPQGNSLRVTVRLVDGRTGADFTDRQTFRVAAGSFIEARDSLAGSVTEGLRKRLGEEIRLRELRQGTQNAEAWALVQRVENAKKQAESYTRSGAPDSAIRRLAEADSLAALAATLDAKWSEPLTGRARIAYQRAQLSRDPKQTAAVLDTALGHTQSALAIDPKDPVALELRGMIKVYRIQRGLVPDQAERARLTTEAETDLRAAVAIAPRQASAWHVLSVLQYAKQNRVESHTYAQKAYEADAYLRAAPSILWNLYATSYDLEDFPDAIRWCAEGRRRFPTNAVFVKCHLYLAITKAMNPDPDSAWRLAKHLEEITPKQDLEYERRWANILVAIVLGRAGRADSAHNVLKASRIDIDADPRGDLVAIEALAHTFFGEKDAAISLLGRYMSKHPEHRAGFATNNAWWWRDLQQDPRFQTLTAVAR